MKNLKNNNEALEMINNMANKENGIERLDALERHLRGLSEEEKAEEVKRIAQIIVTHLSPELKRIKLRNFEIKNSVYFNEDGTPKEQRRIQ